MARRAMTEAERFYLTHGGYGGHVDATPAQRRRQREHAARETARAVAYGEAHGWSFDMEPDEDMDWRGLEPDGADDGCCPWCNEKLIGPRKECSTEHFAYGAVLTDADGQTLASVWGVVDPDTNYTRVLHGELASEALHEVETREAADREAPRYMAL